MEKVANPKKYKGYTREEMKVLRDMTLSDKEVAEKINRTENAVYCKRWAVTKGKYRKTGRKRGPKKVNTPSITTLVSREPSIDRKSTRLNSSHRT